MPLQYDPEKYRRHSIRLKDYDYSTAGAYFVTLCTFNRQCILGEVFGGEVRLNDIGNVVTNWWLKLVEKFPVLETDACVIMPNHVHGIIRIVGADPCVRPDAGTRMGVLPGQGTRTGVPLPRIVQWFKTMTTNQYLRIKRNLVWASFPGRLWQRNYYEHIIRSENALNAIREYIRTNPSQWQDDPEYPGIIG